jgi:hypothetical protein
MMDASPLEHLYTPQEVAKQLGMSVKTLHEHARAGRIRYVPKGGGTKRPRRMFTAKNIQSFIERQKVREVPLCPSTGPKIRPTTTTISKSTVVPFTEVLKSETSAKLSK